MIGVGLGQANVCEHAVCEFLRHIVRAGWMVVEGGYQWEDGSTGIGGTVHVADMDLIEWSLADAKYQRAFFFEAYVGGTLNEPRRDAIGDARESADTTGNYDHRVGRIRAAGDIGCDIRIRLLMNFSRGLAEKLNNQLIAAA